MLEAQNERRRRTRPAGAHRGAACAPRWTPPSARSRHAPTPTAPRTASVARVLIVGCGCRGRELAGVLVEHGHAVRGTSRDEASVRGDRGRRRARGGGRSRPPLARSCPQLDGVSVLCWLMGSARGGAEALHGPRLESLVEALVDTHVRGVVYEGGGKRGAAAARPGRGDRAAGGGDLSHARRGGRTRPGRLRRLARTRWRPPSSECSRPRKSAGGVGVPPAPLLRGGRLAGARHRLPHRRYPHGGTPKPL